MNNIDIAKTNDPALIAELRVAVSETTNVWYNTPDGMNASEYRAFMMNDDY
jgi:hypothetical protein